jgi:hypothetical protein
MRSTVTAFAILISVSSLTAIPFAQASGGRGIRIDLPCPYGGTGALNASNWNPTPTSGPIPYNPGLVTPFSATLVGGSNITSEPDESGLAITAATQYDYYAKAIPNPSVCATTTPSAPLEQVIVYKLAAGNTAGLAGGGTVGLAGGDIEVEFNYNTSSLPTTAGTASFTMGGIKYASTGGRLPTGTDNDFVFSSTGKYVGELSGPTGGAAVLTTNLAPQGWTASSGGGGTTSAPELDATSAASALTLVMGCLMVARGGRRSRKFDAGI